MMKATQPVETPGTRRGDVIQKNATQPVETPGTRRGDVIQKNATQLVEAPGAGTDTPPVEAPSAGPEVLLTGTSNAALHVDQTLPVERLLILPVGLTMMKISRVNRAPRLMATFRAGPQTVASPEMNQLIRNSLRRLVSERPSEV